MAGKTARKARRQTASPAARQPQGTPLARDVQREAGKQAGVRPPSQPADAPQAAWQQAGHRLSAPPFVLAAPSLVALLGIALVGVGIASYLTAVHYAGAPLVCTTSGLINCERVLTSSYSAVGGVPVSVGGIIWFAAMGGLALAGIVRRPEPAWLQPGQIVWSLIGLATVIYLVSVEALALGTICAWCTALHLLIIATLLISILRTPATAPEPEPSAPLDRPARSAAAQRQR